MRWATASLEYADGKVVNHMKHSLDPSVISVTTNAPTTTAVAYREYATGTHTSTVTVWYMLFYS